MTPVPDWWLVVSAIFFILGILSFAVLIAVLLRVGAEVKRLSDRVNELANQVKGITEKVDKIVDKISGDVNAISSTIMRVDTAFDRVAGAVLSRLEKVAPAAGIAMMVMNLWKTFKQARGSSSEKGS
ncbi:MAG: hypothetical protein ACK4XJ_05760 [Fimbriimonadaceae bacterium]